VPQNLRTLEGFPLALLSRLVNTLRSEVLAAGQTAVSKGDVCSKLLIMRDGECTVSSARGTATLRAGDSFGHDGFLHGMPAAEAMVASTATTLWALDANASPELERWLMLLRARHALVRQHAAVTPAQLRVLRTLGKSTTATVQVRDTSPMSRKWGLNDFARVPTLFMLSQVPESRPNPRLSHQANPAPGLGASYV